MAPLFAIPWILVLVFGFVLFVLCLVAAVAVGFLAVTTSRDDEDAAPIGLTAWLGASTVIALGGVVQFGIWLSHCDAYDDVAHQAAGCHEFLGEPLTLALLAFVPAAIGLLAVVARRRRTGPALGPDEPWEQVTDDAAETT